MRIDPRNRLKLHKIFIHQFNDRKLNIHNISNIIFLLFFVFLKVALTAVITVSVLLKLYCGRISVGTGTGTYILLLM
jgi:hypothetical protein